MSVQPLGQPLSNFRHSQDISGSVPFLSGIIVCYVCAITFCTARLYLKATKCVMLLDDCEIVSTSTSRYFLLTIGLQGSSRHLWYDLAFSVEQLFIEIPA